MLKRLWQTITGGKTQGNDDHGGTPGTPETPNAFDTGQALQTAIEHHRNGRLAEAQGIYNRVLEADPENGDALHMMGMLAHQAGRSDLSLDLINRAIVKNDRDPLLFNNFGVVLFDIGRPVEAEAAYRRAVELKPDYVDACYSLGNVLCDLGRTDEAEAFYRRAIDLSPEYAEAHNNLGLLLRSLGRPQEARDAFSRAIECDPGHAGACNNLGIVLTELGFPGEAAAAFRKTMELKPESSQAYCELGNHLADGGRYEEAETAYRQAIALQPDFAEVHTNLGILLKVLGRPEEAEAAHCRAIELKPGYAEAHFNLANLVFELGRVREAEAAYRRAIALKPGFAEAYSDLGNALWALGRSAEAEAACQQAIALKPELSLANSNLGNALFDLGRLSEAETAYRRALVLNPEYSEAHSNLLYSLNYSPIDEEELFKEHLKWGEQHGALMKGSAGAFSGSRDPDRRLRVGYVSPDLRRHPVGYFLLPALHHHDRNNFEFFCYAGRMEEDDLTAELRGYAECWQSVAGMDDSELAEMVRRDGIDILVDLSGHTANNRLRTFAMKPAPVQISWLGYWNTTGLDAMDYILMDGTTVPAGGERFFIEKLLRLPDTRFCYAPPRYAPEVAPLPALANGRLTFGSFNSIAKLTPEVIALWAELLRSIEGSTLVIKWRTLADSGERERLLAAFSAQGVPGGRVELRGQSPHRKMLEEYGDIDIALDPFPFSGGLTSCEALWMGVPVLTLPGIRPVSRQTLTFLSVLGLGEFVASDRSRYLATAQGFAGNLQGLADIRQGLRERMLKSPLCDGERFATNLEAQFRSAWQAWCGEAV